MTVNPFNNYNIITTPSGYISGGMRYYYLKDYQGNNSIVLNQNGVVQQINHYYPYGSLMGEGYSASSQPYRYGGKELVTLGGLNLSDFGARWLDSPSGTFTTMDPLCEKYTQYSPYLYCAGNPIKYIDPSGKFKISVQDAVIILQEYVHYGDNQDGVQQEVEEGVQFELDAYGVEVTEYNMEIIIQEWINRQNINE